MCPIPECFSLYFDARTLHSVDIRTFRFNSHVFRLSQCLRRWYDWSLIENVLILTPPKRCLRKWNPNDSALFHFSFSINMTFCDTMCHIFTINAIWNISICCQTVYGKECGNSMEIATNKEEQVRVSMNLWMHTQFLLLRLLEPFSKERKRVIGNRHTCASIPSISIQSPTIFLSAVYGERTEHWTFRYWHQTDRHTHTHTHVDCNEILCVRCIWCSRLLLLLHLVFNRTEGILLQFLIVELSSISIGSQ